MTFTYDPEFLDTPLHAIRFLIGDTDPDEVFLQDEEILFLEELHRRTDTHYWAASYAAEAIAAKLTREINILSDGQSVYLEGLAEKFRTLALSLRESAKAHGSGAAEFHWAGGDNARQPMFGLGMWDNPEAGDQNFGDAQINGYSDFASAMDVRNSYA